MQNLFFVLKSFLSLFLDKKGRKNQEKTIPTAQATQHRVFSFPTHGFKNIFCATTKFQHYAYLCR